MTREFEPGDEKDPADLGGQSNAATLPDMGESPGETSQWKDFPVVAEPVSDQGDN